MNKERNEMSIKLNEAAKKFLLYSYFGITAKDLNDKFKIITICAQRAYLDLSRTLTFKPEFKDVKVNGKVVKNKSEERKAFKDEICKIIKDGVWDLIKSSPGDYDIDHDSLCKQLKEASKKYCKVNKNTKNDGITYGQAQKWLNMTIKYMWLLGIWESDFKNLIEVIHVPVDSYIIEAVWEYKSVDLPLKEKSNRKYHYTNPSEYVKAWSQWNEYDYTNFQKSLREHLDVPPIEWEGPAWIEIAKERNKQ